jgi:hypothetical protein
VKTRIERPKEFLTRLNGALRPGLTADCVLVSPGEGETFGRLTAEAGQLFVSYGRVAIELQAKNGIAVPRSFDAKARPLVHVSEGHGFEPNNTSNPAGMGLVLPASFYGTAAGVPFADAPAAAIIHAPTGVVGAVSGIWQLLPVGTVDETIQTMKQEVEALGHSFRTSDLWVILSPGARGDTFTIDQKGSNLLLGAGWQFTSGLRVQPLPAPVQEGKRVKTHSLDLVGLFYDLWRFAGVPASQIRFDDRNNMTFRDSEGNLIFPSKRLTETGYASALLGVVVREV